MSQDADNKKPIKELKMGAPQPIYDDKKTINDTDEWQAVRDNWAKEQAGKMHARGPVGVEQLTSFQYRVHGNGQTRP